MSAHKSSPVHGPSAHAAAAALSEPITNAALTANPQHEFELDRISTRHDSQVGFVEHETAELAPVDTGKGAMTFLAAAFFLGKSAPRNVNRVAHPQLLMMRSELQSWYFGATSARSE